MNITQGRHSILYHTYQAKKSFIYRIVNVHKKSKESKKRKLGEKGNITHKRYFEKKLIYNIFFFVLFYLTRRYCLVIIDRTKT